jgi:hypothetical protein
LENDAPAELEPPALQPASAVTDAVTTIARRAFCLVFIAFPFDQVMIGVIAATGNRTSAHKLESLPRPAS